MVVSSNKQGAGAGLQLPEASPQSSSSLTFVESSLQLRKLARPRCWWRFSRIGPPYRPP